MTATVVNVSQGEEVEETAGARIENCVAGGSMNAVTTNTRQIINIGTIHGNYAAGDIVNISSSSSGDELTPDGPHPWRTTTRNTFHGNSTVTSKTKITKNGRVVSQTTTTETIRNNE